ncbi:MAG: hypothetical protein KJO38_00475 [Gammaproteobacteria bacterium]|nr:hypothetical protein [Gammaproteobacteria bacterium]
MTIRRQLLVLDFDGFMIDSYDLLKQTFATFGLDVGDQERFKNRRKFLKYFGGGRELLGNLVSVSLPRKRRLRQVLTEAYIESGRLYTPFVALINELAVRPEISVGLVSRNYTLRPGRTLRAVLRNSQVDDGALDFVIPIPVGTRKDNVLEGMKSPRHRHALLGGDEIGDYRAARATGYQALIGSYGFDTHRRLVEHGKVPESIIHDTPEALVAEFRNAVAAGAAAGQNRLAPDH